MSKIVPDGFEALEPFVGRFALSSTAGRAARRGDSTPEERQMFYHAAKDLVGPALDQLDKLLLGELDEKQQRLLDMVLAFAHVALALEVQGPDEGRHAQLRSYLRITRSPADFPL
jgi:hypothetical protein